MPKIFFYIFLILSVTGHALCFAQPAAGGVYQFAPGSKVIFSDDFSGDAIGAFPSKWHMSACTKKNVPGFPENKQFCTVQRDSNEHTLNVETSPRIVDPSMMEDVYLPDNFAVDFDFTFDTLGRCMEIFFYTNESKDSCAKTVLHLHYMGTLSVVGSAEQNILTVKYPGFNSAIWHHIAFAYKQRAIDIYLDKYRVASIPDGKFVPYRIGLGAIPPVRYKHIRVTSESGVAYTSDAIAANNSRDKTKNKGGGSIGSTSSANSSAKDKASGGKDNGTSGTSNAGGKDNNPTGGLAGNNGGISGKDNGTGRTGGTGGTGATGISGVGTSGVGGAAGTTGATHTTGATGSTGTVGTTGSAGLAANNSTPDGGVASKVATEKAKASVAKILTEKKFVTHDILFDVAKSTITTESFVVVEELTKFLKDNPTIKLEIGGHTDDAGDPKVNMKLSQDRADEVKKQLIAAGIDPGRLTSKGFGSSKPLQSNSTAEGRAANRRVEFIKQ